MENDARGRGQSSGAVRLPVVHGAVGEKPWAGRSIEVDLVHPGSVCLSSLFWSKQIWRLHMYTSGGWVRRWAGCSPYPYYAL